MVRPVDVSVYRFSANVGFLWKERPFLQRMGAAAASGFDAVEFHDEAQRQEREALRDAIAEAGLPVLALNVRMGETSGWAAIPGMEDQARRDIDTGIETAGRAGARALHVLSGKTDAPGAHVCYVGALRHALSVSDLTILIEPISACANPGYFLHRLDQAAAILAEIAHPRLKILFDCFHVEREHGDLIARFRGVAADVGHVQISSAPARAEPWPSLIDYAEVLPALHTMGYRGAFGCEYRPVSTVEAGLGWREALRRRLAAQA